MVSQEDSWERNRQLSSQDSLFPRRYPQIADSSQNGWKRSCSRKVERNWSYADYNIFRGHCDRNRIRWWAAESYARTSQGEYGRVILIFEVQINKLPLFGSKLFSDDDFFVRLLRQYTKRHEYSVYMKSVYRDILKEFLTKTTGDENDEEAKELAGISCWYFKFSRYFGLWKKLHRSWPDYCWWYWGIPVISFILLISKISRVNTCWPQEIEEIPVLHPTLERYSFYKALQNAFWNPCHLPADFWIAES